MASSTSAAYEAFYAQELARANALQRSDPLESGNMVPVVGVDYSKEVTLDSIMGAMYQTGFQATNIGLAIDEINQMINWRLSDRPLREDGLENITDPEERKKTKCTIFLSYTSNMISCGIRETIKFLVKNKMVDVLVTTCGGIEEDFMKCMAPHFLGDFKLRGKDLRPKGLNRLGNLLVPNDNYVHFEEFINPILNACTDEQIRDGTRWTPSKLINRMGKEINNEDSVYYWAWKNDIPVFCPGITDGSIGDMLYFHAYKRPEFYLDIVQDVKAINDLAVRAPCSGIIILGGGIIKHHVCNANLMRNGAEYAVFINTAHVIYFSHCE